MASVPPPPPPPEVSNTNATAAPVEPQMAHLKTAKFFDEGFGKYLENGNFHDVILVHGASKREYKCHRVILSHKSAFFEMLFCARFMESKAEKVTVNFDDPDTVFPNVLEYFYKGETKIDPHLVVAMRVASDQLMCPELSDTVLTYLDTYLNPQNVFGILAKALAVNDDLVLEKAMGYVAKDFMKLQEPFNVACPTLPAHVFFGIFAHENLTKFNAETKERNKTVSKHVKDYCEKHKVMENIELLKMAIDAMVASECLTAAEATMFLVECEKHDLKEQATGCAKIIASNFHSVMEGDNGFIYKLKPHSFTQMIDSDELFVKTEDQVFSLALEYVKRNPNVTETEKKDILGAVRYTFLSVAKLREIKNGGYDFISKKDLLDALFYRAARLEGSEAAKTAKNLPKTFKPRTTNAFTYQSDFDTNGILYWLGTNQGAEAYKNPLDAGYIDVQCAANFEAGSKNMLVGRDLASCNLINQANNWITIIFKKISILPTKYSLRHTNARDGECLRNWKLQGSNDGNTWVDLKDHVNDTTLNLKGQSATWDLEFEKFNDYFSQIRLYQHGMNSASNHYLSLAGMEFYGYVRKSTDGEDTSGLF